MGLPRRMEGNVPQSEPVGGTALGGVGRGVGAGRGLSWARLRASFPPLTRVARWAVVVAPAVAMVVYTFLNVFSHPAPSGDGMTQAMQVRELAETGRLLQHYPYLVNSVSDAGPRYRSIDYPLTFYVIGSFFWMLGGEHGVFVLTALSGAATVLFAYLIFARVNPLLAGLAAAAALLAPFSRFTMITLLEQPLLAVMLGAVYFYCRFLESPGRGQWRYALLTGVLVGLGIGLKQQGYILAAGLALHAPVAYALFRVRRDPFPWGAWLLIWVATVAAMAAPTAEMAVRNGTVLGSDFGLFPGLQERIPFLKSKDVFDQEAIAYLFSILTYGAKYQSVWQVVGEYLSWPLNYGRGLGIVQTVWMPFSLMLLAGALLYSLARRLAIGTVLLAVLVVEVLVTKRFNDQIINYHLLGISAMALLLFIGTLALFGWVVRRAPQAAVPMVAAILVVFGIAALGTWTQAIHANTWGGLLARENRLVIPEYKEMGSFVRQNVPKDALVYGSQIAFAYYARRDQINTTWWGGANLAKVWPSSTGEEAVKWLAQYRIDYVFLDMRQPQTFGGGDWIPSKGLLEFIDHSPYFEQAYRTSKGTLVLYKVLYSSEEPSSATTPH
ncbi:MAG: glycosyltransferase family 39 protein [Chloroflexota bacterium]|nr:glycosyltransferase family 39 protein [Chloroflexota bacterium]